MPGAGPLPWFPSATGLCHKPGAICPADEGEMDGRKKCGKNHTTSPRSAESACAASTCTAGERGFTHPRVGQAERLAYRWQPNAFCGLAPTPTFAARGPKVREKKPGAARPWTLCGLLDFDMPVTKKKPFFSVIEPPTVPPLFALVSRCVGQMGAGRHPYARKTQPQPLLGLGGERTRHLTPALAFLLKWQDDMRFPPTIAPTFTGGFPCFWK